MPPMSTNARHHSRAKTKKHLLRTDEDKRPQRMGTKPISIRVRGGRNSYKKFSKRCQTRSQPNCCRDPPQKMVELVAPTNFVAKGQPNKSRSTNTGQQSLGHPKTSASTHPRRSETSRYKMQQTLWTPLHKQHCGDAHTASNRPRYPCYRLRFGKFEGCTLADVPSEYIQWLIRNRFHQSRQDLHEALIAEGYFGGLLCQRQNSVSFHPSSPSFAHSQTFSIHPEIPANKSYVLNFGKHVGKTVAELPEDYKEWLVFHKYHLSRPELYEALDEDGYFNSKRSPSVENEHKTGNTEALGKRMRENDCLFQCESPHKTSRIEEFVNENPSADRRATSTLDEIADWCRSSSSDLNEWDEHDEFLVHFEMEQSLNAEDGSEHLCTHSAFNDATEDSGDQPAAEPATWSHDHGAAAPHEAEAEAATTRRAVSAGAEVQAGMEEAMAALESGDCAGAVALLQEAMRKGAGLSGALSGAERACLEAAVASMAATAAGLSSALQPAAQEQGPEEGAAEALAEDPVAEDTSGGDAGAGGYVAGFEGVHWSAFEQLPSAGAPFDGW